MSVQYFLGGLDALPPDAKGGREFFEFRLRELGFERTSNILLADLYVAINVDPKELDKVALSSVKKCILIRMESESVWKPNFTKMLEEQFDEIINVGFEDHELSGTFQNWPQYYPSKETFERWPVMEERISSSLLVASDKFSAHKNSNYAIRRTLATTVNHLAIAGMGWRRPLLGRLKIVAIESARHRRLELLDSLKFLIGRKPDVLIGQVLDKLEVAKHYKFALVIENDSTYLTEKIFDAFFAGCFPIYVGPNAQAYGIPTDLFIQAPENVQALIAILEEVGSKDLTNFHGDLLDWLNSEEVRKKWSSESVWSKIGESVANFWRNS